MNIQAALEAPRFTKLNFSGCDVMIEGRVPGGDAGGIARPGPLLTGAGRLLVVDGRRSGGDARFEGEGELRSIVAAQGWSRCAGTRSVFPASGGAGGKKALKPRSWIGSS